MIFLTAITARILSFLHMLWLFTSICNHEFDFVEERYKSVWLAIYCWERNLDNIFRTNLDGYIISCSFTVKYGKDYYTRTIVQTKHSSAVLETGEINEKLTFFIQKAY
jgi:hypothetical protein